MKTSVKPLLKTVTKPKRVRLSLETTAAVKKELTDHGRALGARSMIGAIRLMLARSKELTESESVLYARKNK